MLCARLICSTMFWIYSLLAEDTRKECEHRDSIFCEVCGLILSACELHGALIPLAFL